MKVPLIEPLTCDLVPPFRIDCQQWRQHLLTMCACDIRSRPARSHRNPCIVDSAQSHPRMRCREILRRPECELGSMSDQLPNSMTAKVWVDPYSLPKYDDISTIAGNAPSDVKQLTCNTLGAYGIGTNQECFAHSVGKKLKIVEINIDRDGEKMQCSTVVEVLVSKDMLNGAGMMHGGCVCYIIDNCASLPLVALGVMQKVNGVGVSQAMTVFFHSPASCDVVLTVVSTSIAFGSRIMNARCEISEKASGRTIASAMLSKMQPVTRL